MAPCLGASSACLSLKTWVTREPAQRTTSTWLCSGPRRARKVAGTAPGQGRLRREGPTSWGRKLGSGWSPDSEGLNLGDRLRQGLGPWAVSCLGSGAEVPSRERLAAASGPWVQGWVGEGLSVPWKRPVGLLGPHGTPLPPPCPCLGLGLVPLCLGLQEATSVGMGQAGTCTLRALGEAASSGPSPLSRETMGD